MKKQKQEQENNIIKSYLVDAASVVGKLGLKALYKILKIKEYYDLEDYFKKVGLKNKQDQFPKVIKIYESKKGYTYLINIPLGFNEDDFKKHQKALEIQLKQPIEIKLKNGFIELEVVEKNPSPYGYKIPKRQKDSIVIPIGADLWTGKQKVIDLKESPHSYIVGTTGSGKSVCTKSILTSFVNMYSSNEVELYLCDLKMCELALFRKLKHTKKFVYTVPETTEIIADLLEETKRRYRLFMDNEVSSIFDYNKLPGVKKLKYQVILIEEITILQEDKKKNAMKLLKQLMAISRACGCYCILTTQRPSADIIDSYVKAVISNRIVFQVEDENNSKICLDCEGAEKLKGKGHGILKVGPKKEEFQSYYITDEQVKEYTRKLNREPQKVLEFDEDKGIDEKLNKRDVNNSCIRSECTTTTSSLEDLSFLDNL